MWLLFLVAWQGGEPVDGALWQRGKWGVTAFVTMEHAPFPHTSREAGYQRDEQTFPPEKHYQDATVAIFIPDGFKPDPRGVHLLFYLHGHGNNVRKALDQFDLRRLVSLSEKNVVLVFPQGPVNAPDSGAGKLEEPGGLLRLTSEVVTWLKQQQKIPAAKPGHLILAGHSGAYRGLSRMVRHGGVDAIREVYLLDATYGSLDDFAGWAAANNKHRLTSIFTDHLTKENLRLMAQLDLSGTSFRFASAATHDPAKLTDANWFVYADGLSHNETVEMLQHFLQTSILPTRKP